MVCSRGNKETLRTITKPESKKFTSTTIKKTMPFFCLLLFFFFRMMQHSGNLVVVTILLTAWSAAFHPTQIQDPSGFFLFYSTSQSIQDWFIKFKSKSDTMFSLLLTWDKKGTLPVDKHQFWESMAKELLIVSSGRTKKDKKKFM